jgi:PAS domain S-box-containing protein
MPRTAYRVVLVDDDVAVMGLHANILEAAGFEVLAIDDPVAARDFLGDFAPDACVLDVEMPSCRGTDLAALLRRDKRYARLPLIYLSSFSDIDHQLDARQAGGEDYLVKPVDARLLVTAVMARTQQFRMLETAYHQRRQAWHRLDNLMTALDAQALVSIATADGTIIEVNRKFCEISGYSREELIGRNHRIVKSGHHPTAFFEGMWQTISAGRIWRGEVKNRRKDGSSYWVQSSIAPILDKLGLPEQYISIRTDITAQKHMQEKRQHRTRLLDLLRQAFQQYIANRDIEVTSALLLDGMLLLTNSAYGFLSEVLHDPDGLPYLKVHALANITWNDATRRLYVKKHETGMESRNLDNLIDAVLRTGKVVTANDPADDSRRYGLSEGRPPLEDFIGIPIHYGEILVGIVGLVNRPDGYDASSIVDFLQPFTDTYASILEAARVRHFRQQTILDLQQARDDAERANRDESEFLADWGRRLRTPLNAILGHTQILQMNDTLEAETRQQIAEIAKGGQQLTHLIGDLLGRIGANDTPKTWQEPKAPIMDRMDEVQCKSNSAQRRILVAEDNPANQAVLRMQLGVLGFAVDIAVDGAAAMLKWQAGGHDLILADRNMPVMNGLELTRAIRAAERESGAYVPIIAITAAQHPEELSLCRQAGMDDVLPKPIELDDLRSMLERWLPHASPLASRNDKLNTRTVENKAILNTDYLARIIGNADAKQMRELIDLFTSTARYDLPACRQHLAEHNGRTLALVMHKLKSSASMVGALGFAHLAESLEDAAKANRLDAAAILLTELEHALSDVETVVSQLGVSTVPTINDVNTVSIAVEMLPSCVLVVDDDPVARRQITMLLSSLGVHDVLAVEGAEAALIELDRADGGIDLLISDLQMPGMDGVEFLRHLSDNNYRGCMIISSGVEEQLLQTAAEMVCAKGLNLRGTLKKPVTRDALLQLLVAPCETTAAPSAQREKITVTPNDIQEGIRRNEFDVYFQPKVDATILCVVGMEALARWQHNGKMVSPDVFISIAERHGLIGSLSEVLITKALVGGARLVEEGHSLAIAVNISANWLTDIRLPDFILASVQATGFKAENLILEITETGVMADMSTALDVMTRLRLKGFKLSIDDFGTGYSSMEQLLRIPFGELKLDRSFVQGAIEKTSARAILASTIEMAKKMKLATVAEGVETQAELDLVRGFGCDLVQGWFVAKAMPMDQLLVWLKERGA